MKRAVRRNLADAGLGFGIFDEEGEAGIAPTALPCAHPLAHSAHSAHVSPRTRGSASPPHVASPMPDAPQPQPHTSVPHTSTPAQAQAPSSPAPPVSASVSATETVPLLPFALFAPECYAGLRKQSKRELVGMYAAVAATVAADAGAAAADREHVDSPLDKLKGRFIRRFRWGVLDALDQRHSDYVALCRAVMGWRKVKPLFCSLWSQ